MARRRRSRKVSINTKLMTDVGLAALGVDMLPALISKFFPIDPSLYTAAGTGATYLLGHFMKKSDLANAGLAIGAVRFLTPMIQGFIGSPGLPGNVPQNPANQKLLFSTGVQAPYAGSEVASVQDYFRLNEYTNMPGIKQNFNQYKDSYENL
jgi:hypothetical protein